MLFSEGSPVRSGADQLPPVSGRRHACSSIYGTSAPFMVPPINTSGASSEAEPRCRGLVGSPHGVSAAPMQLPHCCAAAHDVAPANLLHPMQR